MVGSRVGYCFFGTRETASGIMMHKHLDWSSLSSSPLPMTVSRSTLKAASNAPAVAKPMDERDSLISKLVSTAMAEETSFRRPVAVVFAATMNLWMLEMLAPAR